MVADLDIGSGDGDLFVMALFGTPPALLASGHGQYGNESDLDRPRQVRR